jgi:hypothetical protein
MVRHHNINGVQVPFTAEEEAARDAEEEEINYYKNLIGQYCLIIH